MGALVRYHGGKVRLAPKIVALLPRRDAYVEPFGGGGAVLIAKPRSRLEIYNDLDGDMVNLFQVIRDTPESLARAIALTPFARREHEAAYELSDDPVERARRVLIRSHFGHGSSGIHRSTGFRSAGLRAGTLPVHTWCGLPEEVTRVAERMRGVVIENRPAAQVMLDHDSADAVHYVDPPYLPETRDKGSDYRHEMTRADHVEILALLKSLKGAVLLSGYASDLYDDALAGWHRTTVKARADRAADRTEVLWWNFDIEQETPLFSGVQT